MTKVRKIYRDYIDSFGKQVEVEQCEHLLTKLYDDNVFSYSDGENKMRLDSTPEISGNFSYLTIVPQTPVSSM